MNFYSKFFVTRNMNLNIGTVISKMTLDITKVPLY